MRARLAGLALAGVIAGGLGGCGGGAASGGDAAADAGADTRADLAPPDGASDDHPSGGDAPRDVVSGTDAGTDGAGDAPVDAGADTTRVDSGGSCVTQTVVLARGGTTSSCSFEVSTSIDRERVNLSIGGRLCQ